MENREARSIPTFTVMIGIVIIALIAMIAIIEVVEGADRRGEMRALESNAVTLFENAGMEDVNAAVTGPYNYEGYKVYTLVVTAAGAEKVGTSRIYTLIKKVDNYDVTFEKSILMTRYVFDGEEYFVSSYDGTMYRGVEEIYSSDRSSSTISGYPYEGMSEDLIHNTSLGKADKVEPCKDFGALRSERRYKTYKWYDSNENLVATAKTSYYKNGRTVDGYVSNVWLKE